MALTTWADVDPRAVRRTAYYFGTSTVYEGMPVCFDNSTTNWSGVDRADGTESTTTTEGSQNEGKWVRVENPNADNVSMFAGVVAKGSGGIGAVGPSLVDIYIPNGAVVPVRTDSNCLIDQTILAITTTSQELGVPLGTDSRPVAIARETIDRGTAGLCLAELNPERFLYQDSGGTALSVDDADTTTATLVNNLNVSFLSTGSCRAIQAIAQIDGTGHANYGMFKFRTYINAAISQTVHNISSDLVIKESGELTDVGEWTTSALRVSVQTDGADSPDLSGGSLAAIYINYYVTESGGAPANAYVFHLNTNMTLGKWDGLFTMAAGAVGDTASGADEASHVIGFDGDGTTRKIPFKFGGTTYYLLAGTAIQGVADA